MMFNPPHPSETLKELYLDPHNLSITEVAEALNMTRAALSEVVNSRRGISPTVVITLAKAFGGSAESWLHQQADFDLWQQNHTYKADDVRVTYAA